MGFSILMFGSRTRWAKYYPNRVRPGSRALNWRDRPDPLSAIARIACQAHAAQLWSRS